MTADDVRDHIPKLGCNVDKNRGFWYQGLYTVKMWERLQSTERLDVEGGQDIDLYSCHLFDRSSGSPPLVTLAQIKHHLDGTLTLRSSEVRDTIVTFFKQWLKARGQPYRVQLLFVTCARTSKEQNNSSSAIEFWNGHIFREDRSDADIDMYKMLLGYFRENLKSGCERCALCTVFWLFD